MREFVNDVKCVIVKEKEATGKHMLYGQYWINLSLVYCMPQPEYCNKH
jgi:hypothetical protein